MSGRYPDIRDSELAGLLQFANAAADLPQADVHTNDNNASEAASSRKRKRTEDEFIDERLRSQVHEDFDDQDENNTLPLQSAAAVIFRKVTENSKKYSRPPLGKVFTDMELPPEIFLKLQNAAKAYMLDPAHPERKEVVGQKRHDQTVDAKLKLWTCVDQFMELDNNGERFFGHGVGTSIRDAPARTHFWPQDRDKIIKVCMPLFRKLVTNERQRLYAITTRKHKQHNKSDKNIDGDGDNETQIRTYSPDGQLTSANQDESLIERALPDSGYRDDAVAVSQQSLTGTVNVHINVISRNESGVSHRVVPRLTFISDAVPTISSLYLAIGQSFNLSEHEHQDEHGKMQPPTLRVWTERGMFELKTDEDLNVALDRVRETEWMDAQMCVLVQI